MQTPYHFEDPIFGDVVPDPDYMFAGNYIELEPGEDPDEALDRAQANGEETIDELIQQGFTIDQEIEIINKVIQPRQTPANPNPSPTSVIGWKARLKRPESAPTLPEVPDGD